MYGAIIGDIAGSIYEFANIKTKNFPIFSEGKDFTDDSVMTLAVAMALAQWKKEGGDLHVHMVTNMRKMGNRFPFPLGAYGSGFKLWLNSHDPQPYNSCGNGSAMRVSPCGLIAHTLEEALELAKISSEVTHDHPEGIKGAQAVAAAVFLAKTRHTKQAIRDYIHENFYPMDRTCDEIRPVYRFDGTCQGTVPEAIIAFLESETYEDAIRNAISLGGDADTLGAITGSIAWTFYRFEEHDSTADMWKLQFEADEFLPDDIIRFIDEFDRLCWDTYPVLD